MSIRMGRLGVLLSAAGIIAMATVASPAAPAVAHNYYLSSTPGINEVLTKLPDAFTVTTNDNLLDLNGTGGGFYIEVIGPDGLYYGDGCVTVNGPSVSMPAALGPAGDYTLMWQVVSTDGHTVSDKFRFTWKPAPNAETSTVGSTTVPNCGGKAIGTTQEAPSATDNSSTDILWIGGAVVAIALAVVATLMLIRPRKKTDAAESTDEAAVDGTPPGDTGLSHN
ncbi:MAG: copper resistance CopC family protein [Terrimesophilobacter sp.]